MSLDKLIDVYYDYDTTSGNLYFVETTCKQRGIYRWIKQLWNCHCLLTGTSTSVIQVEERKFSSRDTGYSPHERVFQPNVSFRVKIKLFET